MMKRVLILVAILLVFLCLAVTVLPLVVPYPPLVDTAPISELADADSHFVQVNGISVHYKIYGSGEPVMILLHGFGASTFSWREVTGPLSQSGTVIAYDRPAFGLTERPLPGPKGWNGQNPYGPEANVSLLIGLMDALQVKKAVLVGNSAGGTVAVQTALKNPERVSALILVDAAIYPGTSGNRFGLLAPLVNTPQMDRLGPYFTRSLAGDQGTQFLRTAWHDPSKITDAITTGYRKPLKVENWDIALWEYTKAGSGNEDLPQQLKLLHMPVLVLAGDDDQIIPTDLSTQLARDIPGSKLTIITACGHLPQEECPQSFLKSVSGFLTTALQP
jgi:pimeloyl-ACP methyl ester carboxylesterase